VQRFALLSFHVFRPSLSIITGFHIRRQTARARAPEIASDYGAGTHAADSFTARQLFGGIET
jgi:hypothetical protein